MSDLTIEAGARAILATVDKLLDWDESLNEWDRAQYVKDSHNVYTAFHPTIADLTSLESLPVGSLLINVEGNVCEIDEMEFSEGIFKCFIVTGSQEDWPLDRLKLPATLMRHGEEPQVEAVAPAAVVRSPKKSAALIESADALAGDYPDSYYEQRRAELSAHINNVPTHGTTKGTS